MALIGAAFGIGFTFGPLLGAPFVPGGPAAASETVDVSSSSGELGEEPDASPPSSAPGYVAGVLSGLALFSAAFLLPESLTRGAKAPERHWFDVGSFKQAVSHPAIGLVLAAMFLTTFAFAQFESTLALLTKYLGLADRNNYYVFAYIGFILALSQGLLVRRLVPRLGERWMCIAGTALMTLGLALIGASGSARSTAMLYSVLPISVIGFSAVTPSLQSLLSRHTAATQQGGILGLGQSVTALARILGPGIGLMLHGQNRLWPYWVGASIMALSILLTTVLREPAGGEEDATQRQI
jgi:hypothetical protein